MATPTTVTLYDVQVPGVGTAHLKCIATLVPDATQPGQSNGVSLQYVVEVTNGDPTTRIALGREDFLAVRSLKAMV